MNFFRRIEQKFGRFAIPNLMYYIVILYAVGLAMSVVNREGFLNIYYSWLSLDAAHLLRGQIWRVVTFLIYPPVFGMWTFDSIVFGVIALFMYFSLGMTLEAVWGSFRFNVFFFMGMAGQVIACLLGYFLFAENWAMATGYINLSIFLAFCISFPNTQFLMLLIIPVKAKWLAVADACLYLYSFVFGSPAIKCQIAISMANVIIFFLMTRKLKGSGQLFAGRKKTPAIKNAQVRMRPLPARHRCSVCGRTELKDPELEFRYCTKCAGNHEYCMEHLYTHVHVKDEAAAAPDMVPDQTPEKIERKDEANG